MIDEFSRRMKSYEEVTRSVLIPHSVYVIRIDGRSFHHYLRDASKPFDMKFISDMQHVAKFICREITGTQFAYGQSDEISFIVWDESTKTEPWFGGVVQKIVSVAAGMASVYLSARRSSDRYPHFDARVFNLPSWVEAANYILWRQRDAINNSIQMAAQAYWPADRLRNVPIDQLQELLFSHHKVNWNDYQDIVKRGWVISPKVERFARTVDGTKFTERTVWEESSPHFGTIDHEFFAVLRGDSHHQKDPEPVIPPLDTEGGSP